MPRRASVPVRTASTATGPTRRRETGAAVTSLSMGTLSSPTPGRWKLGTAVRLEHFDDFGTTVNGKVSGRLKLTGMVALRGAVSTGFRAPTPGQQHAFNVTTAFIGGQLTNQGVVPSTSAVAMARGGGQLQPETSRQLQRGRRPREGPVHLHRGLFPDRHRRPRRPGAGNQIVG